jgi:Tol biopolymer transport system component
MIDSKRLKCPIGRLVTNLGSSGVGQEDVLVGSLNPEFVEDWSADGKYVVYGTWAPTPTDIWAISVEGDRKPFPVVQSPYRKDEPHFSYDGKWLAYNSEESGQWQVYVISFPTGEQKRQISINGGTQPRWRQDGKELYYLAPDGKMMAVDVTTFSGIGSGIPRALFDTGLVVEPTLDQYAVTPDGQRFLLLKPVAGAAPTPITVVVNWAASLQK